MTEHEKAAMEAAIAETSLVDSASMSIHALIEHGWIAGRAYEPPAVCGALRNANNVCALTEGHDGDHRAPLQLGGYFGWPREQEPAKRRCSECAHLDPIGGHGRGCSKFVELDPDERCAHDKNFGETL